MIKFHHDDDKIFEFSKDQITLQDLSPTTKTRRARANAFSVPRINPHMMNDVKSELRNDDTVLSIINFLITLLSFSQHSIYFEQNYTSSDFVIYIRIFILVLSLSSIMWLIRRYQIKITMLLTRYQISVDDNVFTTGLYKPMLLEIFISLLVIPPYIDFTFDTEMLGYTITYSFSAIMTFFSLIRLYVLLRLFGHYSDYTQEDNQKICSRHSVVANAQFALKCYIQDSPFVGIGIFFLIMSVISSVALQLCEQPDRIILNSEETTESSLRALWDNLWTIFYTTTTIGYGNIYAVTHLGRAISILACILGNMYLGMLVVSITKSMEHTDAQNISYAWISRGFISKDIKNCARNAVRKAATLYLLHKKWKSIAISPITPYGIHHCRNVVLNYDLWCMRKEQYMKKVQLYREMKGSLNELRQLIKQSREVGNKDIDLILDFEDSVRIGFPQIVKQVKGRVFKSQVEAAEGLARSCIPLEDKCSMVRDFSNNLRKRVAHMIKRKTLIPGSVNSTIIVKKGNTMIT